MKRFQLWSLLFIGLSFHCTLFAQSNAFTVKSTTGQTITTYQESHALLIAVSDYTNWQKLPHIITDSQALEMQLIQQGFMVETIFNPTRNRFQEAIAQFFSQYGTIENARLLVYFMGHGFSITTNGLTENYLMPVEAPLFPTATNLVAINDLLDNTNTLASKHIMFMFDALLAPMNLQATVIHPPEINDNEKVRHVIASSTQGDQQDNPQLFLKQFEAGLNGNADLNQDSYVTGTELGLFLKSQITLRSNDKQHPQQGKYLANPQDAGEFFFRTNTLQTTNPTFLPNNDRTSQRLFEPYQQKMTASYNTLREAELQSDDETLLLAGWESFMQNYSDDNPFSNNDEVMRKYAQEQIALLRTALTPTEIPVMNNTTSNELSLTTMQSAFDNLMLISEGSTNLEVLLQGWQSFLDDFQQNFAGNQDDEWRRIAKDKVATLGEQKRVSLKFNAMQNAFKEAQEYEQSESDVTLLVISWNAFINKYQEDFLDTEEDDRIRIQAQERFNYWQQRGGESVENLVVGIPQTSIASKTPIPGQNFTNSIGVEFVWIEPGSFQMGSNAGDNDEKPIRNVEITKGFWISKYELTQAQWQQVTGMNPSVFKDTQMPVHNISWYDALVFTQLLNGKEGIKKYRLPTEAEWEYVARAGSTNDFSFSESAAGLYSYGWFAENAEGSLHDIGTRAPNPWGVFDIHGNVWEWVQDWHGAYNPNDLQDPIGLPEGTQRVLRGGSYLDAQYVGRNANRYTASPTQQDISFGLRLVRIQ